MSWQEVDRILSGRGLVRCGSVKRGRDRALTATMGFEEGCTILSYRGAYAFNSMYRHRFLPVLAENVPSPVRYVSNIYAHKSTSDFSALDEEDRKLWSMRGE